MTPSIIIESWTLDRFAPYKRKLRKNDHALARMEASIQEFGFKIPILVRSGGEVIDGDLRIKAARRLGFTELPVILCDEWTEAQVRAFRLAVNRSVTWAEWDLEMVALEIGELNALDFNLALTGFNTLEIDRFLFQTAEESDDASASGSGASAAAISRSGDLWICGGHRILCGDATAQADVARLLAGARRELRSRVA